MPVELHWLSKKKETCFSEQNNFPQNKSPQLNFIKIYTKKIKIKLLKHVKLMKKETKDEMRQNNKAKAEYGAVKIC